MNRHCWRRAICSAQSLTRSTIPPPSSHFRFASTYVRKASTSTTTPSKSTASSKTTTISGKAKPLPQQRLYPEASKEPDLTTSRAEAARTPPTAASLTDGLQDASPPLDPDAPHTDWARSFHGLGDAAFSAEATATLLEPVAADDVEIKPDGIIYLPEIKYRRILNRAFGPGAWGLAPRGESIVTDKIVTREYALVVHGRLVSVARGEMQYFDADGIPTAAEGCKSNALMRCCKDIGIASELWDPRFIRRFVQENAREAWVEHQRTKRRSKIWLRKDDEPRYPFKEVK